MESVRRVINPYWSKEPLKCNWLDHKGPAAFLVPVDMQQFPNVGLHNLCWLMLDGNYLRNQTDEDRRIIDDVCYVIQHIQCKGRSLSDLAALSTLPDFYVMAKTYLQPFAFQLVVACEKKLKLGVL